MNFRERIGVLRAILLLVIFYIFSLSSFAFAEDQKTDIIFLLDGSGSMTRRLSGDSLWEISKKIIVGLSSGLRSPSVRFGLRIFAHRRSQYDQESSCQDSELIFPIDNYEEGRFATALSGITPQGYTPLAFSLSKLESDFANSPVGVQKKVILLSDGADSCGGNPAFSIEQVRKAGIDLAVFPIGLMIDAKAKTELLDIAAVSGGNLRMVESVRDVGRVIFELSNISNLKAAAIREISPHFVDGPINLTMSREKTFTFKCSKGDKILLSLVVPTKGDEVSVEVFQRDSIIYKGIAPITSELLQINSGTECSVTLTRKGEIFSENISILGEIRRLVDIQ